MEANINEQLYNTNADLVGFVEENVEFVKQHGASITEAEIDERDAEILIAENENFKSAMEQKSLIAEASGAQLLKEAVVLADQNAKIKAHFDQQKAGICAQKSVTFQPQGHLVILERICREWWVLRPKAIK